MPDEKYVEMHEEGAAPVERLSPARRAPSPVFVVAVVAALGIGIGVGVAVASTPSSSGRDSTNGGGGGDGEDTRSPVVLHPNFATVEDLMAAVPGMTVEAAQILVDYREATGLVTDFDNLFDFEDAAFVDSVDAVEAVDAIDYLGGVNAASKQFASMALSVADEELEGGCTVEQFCLNTATVEELDSLKYIGEATASAIVAAGADFCFSTPRDLQTAELGFSSGIKGAITRMFNADQERYLCTQCGCMLCSDAERWVADLADPARGRCESRCLDSQIWLARNQTCLDIVDDTDYGESPREIRFSPKPKEAAGGLWMGVQDRVRAATSSIDVAMYSMSDRSHQNALIDAHNRGVQVRVIMHTSSCAKCSRCTYLGENGIRVRFVTPTMHNKLAVFDYDSLDDEPTRQSAVLMGSSNWSFSSATRYDEDQVYFSGDLAPTTVRAYKQEFEWLWAHSRPCGDDLADISGEVNPAHIEPRIEFDGCFTSYNMEPRFSSGKWGFRYLANNVDGEEPVLGACETKMIAAINSAQTSIRIAHTFFRSKTIFDAVMARFNEGISVYTIHDGKEFLSSHEYPLALADAGADVRYKYYARSWSYSCAFQMHNKMVLVDLETPTACTVISGSENLSEGSEKRIFENIMVSHQPWVCGEYLERFNELTRRGDDEYQTLLDEATCFFQPAPLTGDEIVALRREIDTRAPCFDKSHKEPCPRMVYEDSSAGGAVPESR